MAEDRPAEGSANAKRWSVLAILSAAGFIIVIDTTIMNVSISAIVSDLNTTVTGVQIAITMYALVMAAFMITGGKLGTILGRKRAFIIGTVLFAAGSALTGFANSLLVLTLGWSVIEGLGAAMMLPAIWSLVATNFKGRDRAIAMAVVGGVIGCAGAAGPIIGGLITSSIGWRWAFRLEVFVAALVILFSYVIADEPIKKKARIDYTGVVLSAVGMGTVVFGILISSKWGILTARNAPFDIYGVSPVPFIVLAGIIVLAAFAYWEKKVERTGKEPLVRISLLRIGPFSTGLITTVFEYIVVTGLLFAIPLYMQKVMGLDALATGVGLLPMSIALLVVSIAIPRLSKWFYPKHLVMAGMAAMAAGAFILSLLTPADATRADLILGLSIIGAGAGLLAGVIPNIVMSSVPLDSVNEAAGLNNSTDQIGSALGTALIGAILIASLSWGAGGLVSRSEVLKPELKEEIATVLRKDVEVVSRDELGQYLEQVNPEAREEILRINEEANKSAFGITVLAAGIISLLGMGIAMLLPKEKFAKAGGEEDAPDG